MFKLPFRSHWTLLCRSLAPYRVTLMLTSKYHINKYYEATLCCHGNGYVPLGNESVKSAAEDDRCDQGLYAG